MRAIDDVIAERERQKSVEGWTPEHDDIHTDGEMARAAACYCLGATSHGRTRDGIWSTDRNSPNVIWPWDMKWWKPKNRRRDLVRAAALIVAEIERLDRNQKPTVTAIDAAAQL